MISFELGFFLGCAVFVLGGIAIGIRRAREDADDVDRYWEAMRARFADAEAADVDDANLPR